MSSVLYSNLKMRMMEGVKNIDKSTLYTNLNLHLNHAVLHSREGCSCDLKTQIQISIFICSVQKAVLRFKVDNTLPNLVNLNEDPQLSEVLLYLLQTGETGIGRGKDSAPNGIKLDSALVAEDHWYVWHGTTDATANAVFLRRGHAFTQKRRKT